MPFCLIFDNYFNFIEFLINYLKLNSNLQIGNSTKKFVRSFIDKKNVMHYNNRIILVFSNSDYNYDYVIRIILNYVIDQLNIPEIVQKCFCFHFCLNFFTCIYYIQKLSRINLSK